MPAEKIKVLYIGGPGRSGSTLFERILGQLDNFVAVGELRHMWLRSFVEDQLCGCGKPFKACPFWHLVCEEAFGGYEKVRTGDVLALKGAVDRIRHIPKMLSPWKRPAYKRLFAEYRRILSKLYSAIQRVSGKKIIVDASKDPSTAFLLANLPEIDLHIVHLTRDSRAVGFSWQRKRVRPEITTETKYMATYSPQASAIDWMYRNLLIHSLKYTAAKYYLIRYEDLVTRPIKAISSILSFVGEPPQALDFITGNEVTLNVNHTVAGNPFRFQQGVIDLRLDSEWERNMKRKDKWLITLLTFPLLRSYKYLTFAA